MVTDISINECLAEGWEFYTKRMGLSIGALLLLILLSLPESNETIGWLYGFLVLSAINGGFQFLMLNIARGSDPRTADMFSGFKRYLPLLGGYILGYVVAFGLALLFGLVLGVYGLTNYQDFQLADLGFLLVMGLVFLVIFYLITYRFSFVYFILMDDPQVSLLGALQRSSAMVKGNGHNLFLLNLVLSVIAIALLLLLIIPLFIFGPWLMVSFGRFYIKLKDMHPELVSAPVPQAPPYPDAPLPGF